MDVTFRFARLPWPNSAAFTVDANRRDATVSSADSSSGATFTNMSVLPSPPKHGAKRYVNFEFLYGTCLSPRAMDAKTSPKQESDLLIAHASDIRVPLAPERFVRSDPAKSTRFKHPESCVPVAMWTPVMYTKNNVCDREECVFISVASTARAAVAFRTRAAAAETESIYSLTTPATVGHPPSGAVTML